jgi:hypothetical protein
MDDEHGVAAAAEPRRPVVRKVCFCDQHTMNRLVAKIIPVLLIGAAGFATWVYIAQICGIFPPRLLLARWVLTVP